MAAKKRQNKNEKPANPPTADEPATDNSVPAADELFQDQSEIDSDDMAAGTSTDPTNANEADTTPAESESGHNSADDLDQTKKSLAKSTSETMSFAEIDSDDMAAGTVADTKASSEAATTANDNESGQVSNPAAKTKVGPERINVEQPICPIHFTEMIVSSNQETINETKYWKCRDPACKHTDATVSNGLALKAPVPCPKEICRNQSVFMILDKEQTKAANGQRLFFVCPTCGHRDDRRGKSISQMENRLSDLINR